MTIGSMGYLITYKWGKLDPSVFWIHLVLRTWRNVPRSNPCDGSRGGLENGHRSHLHAGWFFGGVWESGSPEKRGVFGMLELLGCPAGSDRNKLVSWFILPILGTYPTYLYRGYNPFTK